MTFILQMITMPGCTDSFCKECFKINFSIAVSEKGVKHFNCPMCSQPDMTDLNDGTQDLYQQLFVQLVKLCYDSRVLYQHKRTSFADKGTHTRTL